MCGVDITPARAYEFEEALPAAAPHSLAAMRGNRVGGDRGSR